jgi:poly-gamma-glutamate synthesis protein (capsule biosynthesis protein)
MPTARSRAPRGRPAATLLVAADWAPIRAFDPIVRQDPLAVYGDLLPVLRRADLRIVNCECALTRAAVPVWKSGAVFKGEPRHVSGLTAVPFDVACLANNHVLDYGVRGLRDTLRVLERHGIRHVGAGLDEVQAHAPLALRVKGVRVSVVNFSEGEDLTAARHGPGVFGWDIARAADLVRQCKRRGGIVIAIGHCGLEYVPYPPPYVVTAFRALADAGADAVVGHHPHVPQGLEWHHGRLIVYSLGNFVFYQPANLYYRKVGYCLSLRVEGQELAGAALHPYRITDAGLRALTGDEDRAFRRTLIRISRPFRAPGGAGRAWEAYLAHYGQDGFTAEVTGILDRMRSEPQKGAAMFRNRITTMQHAELWRETLTRMMAGAARRPSRAAGEVVREWFERAEVSASEGRSGDRRPR